MKFLALVFFGLALYGAWTGAYGAALISLAMAGFMIWAERVFNMREHAWLADPSNAAKPRSTQEILDRACVECSTPNDLH